MNLVDWFLISGNEDAKEQDARWDNFKSAIQNKKQIFFASSVMQNIQRTPRASQNTLLNVEDARRL